MKDRLEAQALTDEDRFVWQFVWTLSCSRGRPLSRDNYAIWQDARNSDRKDADIMHALGHRHSCPPDEHHEDCVTCEQFVGYYIDVAVAKLARTRPRL